MPTVSIAKGKGYTRHNDRSLDPKDPDKKSWDSELSQQNIIYRNEPIQGAYNQIFGHALEEYNQSQIEKGRADRQIKNYYDKISRSKQEKTCYELVIQIGSMEDKANLEKYEAIQKALDEYNQSFQTRNPNFRVFQQITHRDEKGMDHTHIMFVPVSTGNKRGLETKNSLSGALKEMGYDRNGFDKWREHELESIKEILRTNDLEFELGDGRREHLNVRQYREYKKYESLTLEKQNTLSELEKMVSERTEERNKLDVEINAKRSKISDLDSLHDELVRDNRDLMEANELMEQEMKLLDNRRIFKNFSEMDPKEQSICFHSNKMTVIKSDGTQYTTRGYTQAMLNDLRAGRIKMGAWLPEEMVPVPKSVINELIKVRNKSIELSKETSLFIRTFEALKRNIDRIKTKVKTHFER